MSAPCVLITGATGYLGGRVAAQLLATSDATLLLAVRSADARAQLTQALGAPASRVDFLELDLAAPEAAARVGDDVLARVTHVLHAAAVTRFNVERDVARRVNVEGTEQVVALARRCPRLESFGYASTLYSTGLRSGRLDEQLYDDAGFANHYEWSKWCAEHVVADAGDLPWRILRVATVIADGDSGGITQYNAFHETLKLCFYGLLSLLPGRATTPLYLVTGDFATDALIAIVNTSAAEGIFHVSHDRTAAATLEEVLDIVFDRFELAEDFRRKRILRPLLADEASFDLLVEGVSPMAGSLVTQALSNVSPFAHQLYVDKAVDTSRLSAVFPPPRADVRDVVAAAANALVETRWGRRASA
ncbi:MAG TPA: SDR family oxidoreductase [Mycobacteriales bacterium]|nr:SDR family oxidoreductase [Mycobacteriales bacterium]